MNTVESSDDEVALIAYLTDPQPTPVQWDIQHFVRYCLARPAGDALELSLYFENLLDVAARSGKGASSAEVLEISRLAEQVPSLDGVDWNRIREAVGLEADGA